MVGFEPRFQDGCRSHAVYYEHYVVAYQYCGDKEVGIAVEPGDDSVYKPAFLDIKLNPDAVGCDIGYFGAREQGGEHQSYYGENQY